MLDPRIYRAAFLPLLAAIVLLMFSLDPAAEPLEQPLSAPTFTGKETARQARAIAELAPDRTPGSEGDAAIADLVRERFGSITGAELTEQTFSSSFEGADVELENVILTLPGQREEVLLIVAERDSPEGVGATTSASSTATLISLAEALGGARHERTIVLASTSGGGIGSAGVRELVEQLPAPSGIEAAIAITNAGVKGREPPFVVPGRSSPESLSDQLLSTAAEIASVQFERSAAPAEGALQFARLAFPFGIGPASAMRDEGVPALAISGSGRRPPEAEGQSAESISRETVFMVGSSALNLVLALDESQDPPESSPGAYVKIGENLLPGWTLAVLALALLLPALLASGDAWLRDRRRSGRSGRRSMPWALERVLLPLAALLLAYALGVIGLIPSPSSPYDPGRFPGGLEAPVAFVAIALAVALAALLVRPLRTPLDAEPHALAAAAGLLCSLSVLGIWLINPFLALLLTPAAHVWILPARAQGPPSTAAIAATAVISLLPALIAAIAVASAFELGIAAAPWQLLLAVVGGQVGPLLALLWCGLLGGLISCVAARFARREVEPPEARRRNILGPTGHVGPGSLGGTPSGLPRA